MCFSFLNKNFSFEAGFQVMSTKLVLGLILILLVLINLKHKTCFQITCFLTYNWLESNQGLYYGLQKPNFFITIFISYIKTFIIKKIK